MRRRIIRVRASEAEIATMKDIAMARGLSISELIRRSALAVHMPARVLNDVDAKLLVRAIGAIGHVGGNLNQLVRRAHSGKLVGHDVELSETLSAIDGLRGRIRDIVG